MTVYIVILRLRAFGGQADGIVGVWKDGGKAFRFAEENNADINRDYLEYVVEEHELQ